eukprot:UN10510
MPRRRGFGGFGGSRRRRSSPKPKRSKRRQSNAATRTRRPPPPPPKAKPATNPLSTTQSKTQSSGPSIGGGGLGSAIATGMAFGVGSGVGHAAAGSLMDAVSGSGEDEGGVMYDDDNNDQMNTSFDEHPCMRYWEQFQQCMNMNTNDIGGCQNLYDVFNRCQRNPDGFL